MHFSWCWDRQAAPSNLLQSHPAQVKAFHQSNQSEIASAPRLVLVVFLLVYRYLYFSRSDLLALFDFAEPNIALFVVWSAVSGPLIVLTNFSHTPEKKLLLFNILVTSIWSMIWCYGFIQFLFIWFSFHDDHSFRRLQIHILVIIREHFHKKQMTIALHPNDVFSIFINHISQSVFVKERGQFE